MSENPFENSLKVSAQNPNRKSTNEAMMIICESIPFRRMNRGVEMPSEI